MDTSWKCMPFVLWYYCWTWWNGHVLKTSDTQTNVYVERNIIWYRYTSCYTVTTYYSSVQNTIPILPYRIVPKCPRVSFWSTAPAPISDEQCWKMLGICSDRPLFITNKIYTTKITSSSQTNWVGYTSPKTNMHTQNDGLEKVDSFKIWPFLVSMLDFWGVYHNYIIEIQPSYDIYGQSMEGRITHPFKIPRTQITLAFVGKGLVLEGWSPKIEDKQVPGALWKFESPRSVTIFTTSPPRSIPRKKSIPLKAPPCNG